MLAQASCLGHVRLRALLCVITPVAMRTAASIESECGGKGFSADCEKSRLRFVPVAAFYRSRAEDKRPTPAAS